MRLIEVAGLLDDPAATVEHLGLPDDLVTDGALDRTDRVEVLGLRTGAELLGAPRTQGNVGIAAQLALLHAGLGDPQSAQQLTQFSDVSPRHRCRPDVGLGDDLDQRNTGPVVVEQGMRRSVDTAVAATDVQRLSGVFFHMDTGDSDPMGLTVDLDIQVSADAQRLVVLADLEVLRHVRVEVVLPREPAPAGDLAVQRETDAHGERDRRFVDHRQGAGEAEAHRAHLGVGVSAEGRRASAEHLGDGAELDVGLQADHRLEVRTHGRPFRNSGHESILRPWLLRQVRYVLTTAPSRPATAIS